MSYDCVKEIKELLKWNDQYRCLVALVDTQHKGILDFINDWCQQLMSTRDNQFDLAQFMELKIGYLDRYSKTHLRFEEEMLSIMVTDFGFPKEEYERHVTIHKRFINEFMVNVNTQMQMLNQRMDKDMIEHLAGDALSDVARWWYGHIKGPTDKLLAGPDHVYRLYLQKMAAEDLVALLNRLLQGTCKFAS
ncbi:MAG: hemerythrin family protein [Desulfarculus sp.]|nr:hemerythrin family protein [Desulfarculus sp.]